MDWVLDAGVGVLGFLTFLVIYFWVFSVFLFHKWWENYSWYWNMAENKRNKLAIAATFAGGAALWLSWEFLLPAWWKEATPMLISDA